MVSCWATNPVGPLTDICYLDYAPVDFTLSNGDHLKPSSKANISYTNFLN